MEEIFDSDYGAYSEVGSETELPLSGLYKLHEDGNEEEREREREQEQEPEWEQEWQEEVQIGLDLPEM